MSSVNTRIYCVDTSALIDGLERYYPETSFPKLWHKIDELVEEGRFVMSEEVWTESREKDLATKAWCDRHDKEKVCHITDAEVIHGVQLILDQFPKIVAGMKGRNRGDPFVIAVARIRNATIITGEGADGNERKPKIPYIANELNLESYHFLDIIKLEGWEF